MRSTRAACVATALVLTWFLVSSNVSAQSCPGDCSDDLTVTIEELIACVKTALGASPLETCLACDFDRDGTVVINELVMSVNVALGRFTITGKGTCKRPGSMGLDPCTEGTMVEISRCDDRARCFDDSEARTLLDVQVVGSNGVFSFTISGCEVLNAVLLFEAAVDAETDTTYRLIDFGPTAPVGTGGPPGSLGRGGGVRQAISISPISEAAVRLLEEIGLDGFDDAGVRTVIEAVEKANAQTRLGEIPAAEAAELATETARGDAGVQAAIQSNLLTPTPTFLPEPT